MGRNYTPITQAQFIKASVSQVVVLANVGTLGLNLGLDPEFSNIIGLSLGAVQGTLITNPSTPLEQAFSFVKPDIASSMASYGVQKIGNSLGIDPRASSLALSPISGAINRSFDTSRLSGQDIITSVIDGMQGAAIQIGYDYAIDQLNIDDPFLEALTTRGITSVVSAVMDPNDRTFMTSVWRDIKESAVDLIRATTKVDFIQYATQNGIEGALKTYATEIFTREGVEEIHRMGGIADLLTGRARWVQENGVQVKEIRVTPTEYIYLDGNRLYRHVAGNTTYEGSFFIVDGKFVLTTGTKTVRDESGRVVTYHYENGQVKQTDIVVGPEGERWIRLEATPQNPILIDGDYKMYRGAISFPKTGTKIEFRENEIHIDVTGASLSGAPIMREIIPTQNLTAEEIKQLIQIILVDGFNGLNPSRPSGTLPTYFAAGSPFRQKLQQFGVTGTDGVPLYEEFIPLNIKDWLESVSVRQAVTNKFIDITNRQPGQPFVPLGYSGGGMPILLALSDEKYKGFGVDSVVLVGSPTLVTDLRWTSVDRVVNIYGSKEQFLRGNESALIQMLGIDPLISDEVLGSLPRVSHKFTRDNGPMETINIEIKGIDHIGYFYDAADPNPNPLKVKANNFIAQITQASLSPLDLEGRLLVMGVPYENITDSFGNRVRTYKVDLDLIS